MSNMRSRMLAVFAEQKASLQRFLARRLGDNAALAEDLTQEVWLRVATAEGVESIRNPKSYLFRIASNLAIDHIRHRRYGVELSGAEDYSESVADPRPSPETEALHRSELRRLLAAVDRLPPRTREVFLLAKLQDMSYLDIAQQLGIARNTVMVHMTSALALLERYLHEGGKS
ncbi:RNA polymerase sigma factor [Ferrovibrio sp.]|uniref:RNA polymerase sigma factor n=1 Tax=Ferrovibrio sp. TaxID=1917215 RepID=UPI0025C5FEB6|nr:RNA polymerase sigma factor [Ferrovibrio sp.]MBX3455018.1 RNA polymerase sigma factor [Ferrovibrio sp.]